MRISQTSVTISEERMRDLKMLLMNYKNCTRRSKVLDAIITNNADKLIIKKCLKIDVYSGFFIIYNFMNNFAALATSNMNYYTGFYVLTILTVKLFVRKR